MGVLVRTLYICTYTYIHTHAHAHAHQYLHPHPHPHPHPPTHSHTHMPASRVGPPPPRCSAPPGHVALSPPSRPARPRTQRAMAAYTTAQKFSKVSQLVHFLRQVTQKRVILRIFGAPWRLHHCQNTLKRQRIGTFPLSQLWRESFSDFEKHT